MLMDCPRCGFNQPKDQFCAKCGVDVQAFRPRPKPLLKRLSENTGLHIVLAALLLSVAVVYILFSRVDVVSRQMTNLLAGAPLSSREAAVATPKSAPEPPPAPVAVAPPPTPEPAPAAQPAAAVETAPPVPAAAPAVEPQHFELAFFEIPHDQVGPLVSPAEHNGQGDEGRAFYFKDASKLMEFIKPLHHLSSVRGGQLRTGAQAMVVTPPTTPDPFQFGLAVQVAHWENHEAAIQWNSQLVLTSPESPAEQASNAPQLRAAVASSMNGAVTLHAGEALLLLFEIDPVNRHPRDEFVLKAGEGPWSIFGSDDFRSGNSDWIAVVHLK